MNMYIYIYIYASTIHPTPNSESVVSCVQLSFPSLHPKLGTSAGGLSSGPCDPRVWGVHAVFQRIYIVIKG